MIEEYRRANKSPNLFQHYINDAIHYSDLPNDALSVFVFTEQIRVTLPPNDTHIFRVDDGSLKEAIQEYYKCGNADPVDFTLDFSDNTITIGDE